MSSSDSRPLIGNRTTVPSRLIKSAVGLVQTSETRCPAINNLVPNKRAVGGAENEYVVFHDSRSLDRTLLARGLDFFVIQAENGTENFFGVLSQERRAPNVRR